MQVPINAVLSSAKGYNGYAAVTVSIWSLPPEDPVDFRTN